MYNHTVLMNISSYIQLISTFKYIVLFTEHGQKGPVYFNTTNRN